ncbi:MAG: hypothetical protein M3N47_03180, partial [Chloroflexota bacterium]|nr:hypothetical protein [Chloroflexota bacterium]
AAMMLCVQLALVGVGASVIALFPRQKTPERLLDTSFSIVAVAALCAAVLFLVLSSAIFRELRIVASHPVFALSFLVVTALGALGVLLDQASTALRRGDHALARNVLSGVVTLTLMTVIPFLEAARSAVVIFSTWFAGALAACALGVRQFRRAPLSYSYRPRFDAPLGAELIRIGLPNYFLTLAERAPGPLLPIIVTELLSPADNAYWYAVWMMAWVVFIIPIQSGISLFAEVSHRPDEVSTIVRHSIRSSLALGLLAAIALAVTAEFALGLLGPAYAEAGAMPLRIVVLAVVPTTFVQAYFAACRGTQRLREAIATGVVSTTLAVAVAAAAGPAYGLPGIAIAWVLTQSAAGVWSLWRLRTISRESEENVTDRSRPDPVPAASEPIVSGPL